MKKLIIWLAILLPFIANAQVNGTIQKTVSSGVVRGNFGSSGVDTLVKSTALINYVQKSGDTMTGQLNGTSIVLSGNLTADSIKRVGGTANEVLMGDGSVTDKIFINVKDYGAVGNGIANDRTAIMAALTAAVSGNTVYFPNGTYLTDSLTIPQGVKLLGASNFNSKIKIVTGSSYLLLPQGENVIEGLYLLGSNPTKIYTTSDVIGSETGIKIDGFDNVTIDKCFIIGFNNAAIYGNNFGADAGFYGASLKITNTITQFNYYGLHLDDNAQYSLINNTTFLKSRYGVYNIGGNNSFSNCQFVGGVDGFYYGNGSNEAHGSMVGSSFNHASRYALRIENVTLGQVISDCQFYEGTIYINGSRAIKIDNSIFSVDSLILGANGTSSISNSVLDSAYGGVIVRDYLGEDNFYLFNNRWNRTLSNSDPVAYALINDPVILQSTTLAANTPGTSGQVLTSAGANAVPTWTTPTTGTVTSVAISGANGIGVASSPITTNGTIALSLGAITPTSVNTGGIVGTNVTSSATATLNTVNISGLQTNTTANSAADALRYNQIIAATNAYNSNAAAGTMYQFKFNSAGDLANAGGISVNKENTTSGDFASEVGLYNRANGGNMTKVFKVSSAGIPQIPLMTGASTEMVTISTDGTLGRTAIPTGGGGGSVATIGIASANGLAGTSDGNATNPTLTLSTSVSGMVKANGTAFSAAVGDTDFQVPLTFSTGLTRSVNTITVNQAFTPTWTGIHTFSNDIKPNAQIDMSSQSAARIIGGSTDFAIQNNANNANNILVLDNGNTTVRGVLYPLSGVSFSGISGGRIIGGITDFGINNNAGDQLNLLVLDNGNTTVRGTFAASNFSGSSSGTNTGDQTTITGNAGTATALQTARNIQGVSFNGTADINPINGTGFVKATGTTLSYDNSTYLTTSSASSTYAPLASPTFTGTPSLPTGTIAVTQTQGDNSTKIATTAYADGIGSTVLAAQKQIANIYTNTSTTGTTTQTLFTSNIAQSNLSADGDRIDFNFAGSFGLNANDKFVYLSIGGNTIAVSGNASSKSFWECEGYLLRTSSTTFRLFIRKAVDYVYSSAIADYTVTDFNPLTFSVLGQTNNASFPVTVQMGYLQSKKAP